MKKTLILILSLAFVFSSFSIIAAPTYAQTEDPGWEYDAWDNWESDDWEDTDIDTTYETTFEGDPKLAAFFGGFMLIFIIGIVAFVYLYSSITLMKIAKRLNYENAWFAWIPILNIVLLFKMGDMNPLLVLLVLIPGLGQLAITVVTVIAFMNICEKLGYDKLLGLLALIPIGNFVLPGMLAWGKKESLNEQPPQQNSTPPQPEQQVSPPPEIPKTEAREELAPEETLRPQAFTQQTPNMTTDNTPPQQQNPPQAPQ